MHDEEFFNIKSNQFDNAIFFLERSGLDSPNELQTLQSVYHNAVLYYVKNNNFSKARFYASKSGKSDLTKYIDEREAFDFYEKGSLDKARQAFQRLGNQQMVKAVYSKQYNVLYSRVAGLSNLATMRSHKSDYRKMLELAQKMEDPKLTQDLRRILDQLQ